MLSQNLLYNRDTSELDFVKILLLSLTRALFLYRSLDAFKLNVVRRGRVNLNLRDTERKVPIFELLLILAKLSIKVTKILIGSHKTSIRTLSQKEKKIEGGGLKVEMRGRS